MLDRRSFHLLWVSQGLSNAGDVFYIVALISLVFSSTHNALSLSLIPVTITFSRLAGSLAAPLLIDRFKLKQILVQSMSGKTLLLFVVFALSGAPLTMILVLVSMNAFLDGFASPTRNAMIPDLAGDRHLEKANSLISITDNGVNIASWPLGALFVTVFSERPLLGVTVIIYGTAVVLMLGVRHTGLKVSMGRQSFFTKISDGWKISWKHSTLRSLFFIDFLTAFAGSVWISAILYVYVDEILGKGEAWWGYINSAYSVGFLIGGYLFYRFTRLPLHKAVIWGLMLTGIGTILFTYPFSSTWSLIVSLFLGIVGQIQGIAMLTILQTNANREKLAHIFSAQDVVITGTFGVGTLLFGWLAEERGIETVFLAAAALSFVCGVFAVRKQDVLIRGNARPADV
ncbi:MAG TPA: MFS transporter [Bacillaceae bacterium]